MSWNSGVHAMNTKFSLVGLNSTTLSPSASFSTFLSSVPSSSLKITVNSSFSSNLYVKVVVPMIVSSAGVPSSFVPPLYQAPVSLCILSGVMSIPAGTLTGFSPCLTSSSSDTPSLRVPPSTPYFTLYSFLSYLYLKVVGPVIVSSSGVPSSFVSPLYQAPVLSCASSGTISSPEGTLFGLAPS